MRILARKAFKFKSGIVEADKKGHELEKSFTCVPFQLMDAPDWIKNDSYFDMVVEDGDIEVTDSKKQEKAIEKGASNKKSPDSIYKGSTKEQIVAELNERKINFDLNASQDKLEKLLITDDKKSKKSADDKK